jgi:hypothetical protein
MATERQIKAKRANAANSSEPRHPAIETWHDVFKSEANCDAEIMLLMNELPPSYVNSQRTQFEEQLPPHTVRHVAIRRGEIARYDTLAVFQCTKS